MMEEKNAQKASAQDNTPATATASGRYVPPAARRAAQRTAECTSMLFYTFAFPFV